MRSLRDICPVKTQTVYYSLLFYLFQFQILLLHHDPAAAGFLNEMSLYYMIISLETPIRGSLTYILSHLVCNCDHSVKYGSKIILWNYCDRRNNGLDIRVRASIADIHPYTCWLSLVHSLISLILLDNSSYVWITQGPCSS